jgi:alkylation response protein AidB-like acyl-CoA dehydrogenase
MLLGILERLAGEAHAYSTIRRQGGRKIIDHAPVRRMLDAMTETTDLFAHWLQRLESCPDLDYSGVEIRRQALRASDYGLQIFGGGGYVCPSLSERCWRDVRQVVALCGN